MARHFKHLLVDIDASASAKETLQAAGQLAYVLKAQVTAIFVESNYTGSKDLKKVTELVKQINKDFKSDIFLINRRSNKKYKEIVNTAADIEADLIVLGNKPSQGIGGLFSDTETYKTISLSQCPVLLIKQPIESQLNIFKRIVLPLDDFQRSRQKIPLTAVWAGIFKSIVHVFAVSDENDNDAQVRIQSYSAQAQKVLDDKKIEHTFDISMGKNIASSIIDFTKSIEADLVISLSHEASAGFFKSNDIQKLIANCPVTILFVPSKDYDVSYAEL